MADQSAFVVSFNCGRSQVKPTIFASHISNALPRSPNPPQFIALCLQEVAPIAYSFLGGSLLQPYIEKFEHAIDVVASSFRNASYIKVASRNVGMTVILIFALKDVAKHVEMIEYGEVGVGLWEMGNKGGVGVRISNAVRDNVTTTLTFVSAHLAPMEWGTERRNKDWRDIVQRLVFEPDSPEEKTKDELEVDSTSANSERAPLIRSGSSCSPSGMYTPTSHLIIAGDLNYRTSSSGPVLTDTFLFPQPSEDESYPRHYWHLLSSDQLRAEMRAGRTCHGLREAPIDFPPTYKYSETARRNIASGAVKAENMDKVDDGKWDWAQHRWPSWCDRILYLATPSWSKGGKLTPQGYTALPLMPSSDHRPVACMFQIPAIAIPESDGDEEDVRCNPPFDIDPTWKGRRWAARRLEVLVGVLALLTTTSEALWLLSVVVVFLILLWTGLSFAGNV